MSISILRREITFYRRTISDEKTEINISPIHYIFPFIFHCKGANKAFYSAGLCKYSV